MLYVASPENTQDTFKLSAGHIDISEIVDSMHLGRKHSICYLVFDNAWLYPNKHE